MYYLKIDWSFSGYELVVFDCESDMMAAVEYIKRANEVKRDEELILEEVCSTFKGKLLTDEVYELELD